jgi:uncharacterized membrane protein
MLGQTRRSAAERWCHALLVVASLSLAATAAIFLAAIIVGLTAGWSAGLSLARVGAIGLFVTVALIVAAVPFGIADDAGHHRGR